MKRLFVGHPAVLENITEIAGINYVGDLKDDAPGKDDFDSDRNAIVAEAGNIDKNNKGQFKK